MLEDILLKKDEFAALCLKHHVRKLAVFGSALRDDFDPARSDVDFVVEFDQMALEEYVDNKFELRKALAQVVDRPIDLITWESIRNKYLRREVETTQEFVYGA